MEKIVVSIICNTYNHEKYIAEAIESFLNQETNFEYEILIHDDASTDKTADIIRKYEMKFPDIIKPIYQIKNQYSKHVDIGKLNRSRAAGQYYAICEGDDYWIDRFKLQKQVDFLEKNSDYSVCVHSTFLINAMTNKKIGKKRPCNQSREFITDEIIRRGGGLFATNSMVYRTNLGSYRPNFYYHNKTSFGDYQLIILLSLIGKVYYIDEYMSAYRYNVPGSWTFRNLNKQEHIIKHLETVNIVLDEVNKETNYIHDDAIKNTQDRNNLNILLEQGEFKVAKVRGLKEYYNSLGIKKKIILNMRHYFPEITDIILGRR